MNQPRRKSKAVPAEAESGREGVVRQMLENVERQLLTGTDQKTSVADYIRLVQLHREMKDDATPTAMEVRWVDEPATE